MIFSLLIHAAPYSHAGSSTALRFAESVIAQGHRIYRLFFYLEGVHNANQLSISPQDETDLPETWQQFNRQHNIDSVVCIAAALRRGIIDDAEAARYGKLHANLSPGHELAGLGQLIDALNCSDRLITFGN